MIFVRESEFWRENEEKTGDIPNQWEKEKTATGCSSFQFVRRVFQILHLAQQFVGRLLQFDKAEPLLAKVFETCADQINGIVNAQESVMCAVKLLYLNGRVLRIVFLKIKPSVSGGHH